MRSNRYLWIVAALPTALTLLSACSAAATPAALPSVAKPARTITVVGQGKASGTPDVAHVSIGVETAATSAQEAVTANRQQMIALLEKMKAMGVTEKDIQTSNYSIFAERSEANPPKAGVTAASETITYRVSNMVSVTVRDTAKLGDVLDQAVGAGANAVYGVSFEVSDTSKLEAVAREKAIADARSRAEGLAKLTTVSLGEVQEVSEVIGTPGPIYARSAMEGLGAGTPIQPGELEMSLSVEVTYAIE
jgi:uncharacterized protein YggE